MRLREPEDTMPQRYCTAGFELQRIGHTDQASLQKIGELWREIYDLERGILTVPDADEILNDEFHPHSDYFVAYARGQNASPSFIGSVRVVWDSPAGLPIERFFPLQPIKRHSQYVEAQRLMVKPAYRHRRFPGARYGVSGLLMKAVIATTLISRNHRTIAIDAFGDSRESPIHAFRQMGASILGSSFIDKELDSATPSLALLLTLQDIAEMSCSHGGNFARYLLEYEPAIAGLRVTGTTPRMPEQATEASLF